MRMLAMNQKADLRRVSANFRIRLVVAARAWAVREATFGVFAVGFPLATTPRRRLHHRRRLESHAPTSAPNQFWSRRIVGRWGTRFQQTTSLLWSVIAPVQMRLRTFHIGGHVGKATLLEQAGKTMLVILVGEYTSFFAGNRIILLPHFPRVPVARALFVATMPTTGRPQKKN